MEDFPVEKVKIDGLKNYSDEQVRMAVIKLMIQTNWDTWWRYSFSDNGDIMSSKINDEYDKELKIFQTSFFLKKILPNITKEELFEILETNYHEYGGYQDHIIKEFDSLIRILENSGN